MGRLEELVGIFPPVVQLKKKALYRPGKKKAVMALVGYLLTKKLYRRGYRGGGPRPPFSAESYYGNYIKAVSFWGPAAPRPPANKGWTPLSKFLRPSLVYMYILYMLVVQLLVTLCRHEGQDFDA